MTPLRIVNSLQMHVDVCFQLINECYYGINRPSAFQVSLFCSVLRLVCKLNFEQEKCAIICHKSRLYVIRIKDIAAILLNDINTLSCDKNY